MLNDLRGYLQLANGLTEVTASKAKEMAATLIAQGLILSTKAPDLVGQVQELADDLLSTSRNNREMLKGLVRSEVDRTVSRMGFVREDELAAVRRHIQRLEQELHSKNPSAAKPAASATKTSASKKAAKKSTPKPPAHESNVEPVEPVEPVAPVASAEPAAPAEPIVEQSADTGADQ